MDDSGMKMSAVRLSNGDMGLAIMCPATRESNLEKLRSVFNSSIDTLDPILDEINAGVEWPKDTKIGFYETASGIILIQISPMSEEVEECAKHFHDNLEDLGIESFIMDQDSYDMLCSSSTNENHYAGEEVKTSNTILNANVLDEANSELTRFTGIEISRKKFIELMELYDLDLTLQKYGSMDTAMRERLADALSEDLIDKSWPSYAQLNNGEGLYNFVDKETLPFANELNKAATEAGFKVHF